VDAGVFSLGSLLISWFLKNLLKRIHSFRKQFTSEYCGGSF